jgi:16S rRNA (guanine1207-N2)-methyltransferase
MGQEMTKPERKEFDRGPRAHYFTKDDSPAIMENSFPFTFGGHQFTFETGPGLFSKEKVDTGSRIMVQEFCKNEQPSASARILDLGCGYGFIGVVLGAIFEQVIVDFVDVNMKATKFAARNAKNNGFSNSRVYAMDFTDPTQRSAAIGDSKYDYALINPPVKAGKQVMGELVDGAMGVLRDGGILYVVVRTSLGAKSWQSAFEARDDATLEVFREGGYRVFKLVKVHR